VSRRWFKKREFMFYYMLLKYSQSAGRSILDFGEAVDAVRAVVGSKRVAENIVRGLIRRGLLERVQPLRYRVRGLEEVLDEQLVRYVGGRIGRRGYDVEGIDVENMRIVVVCSGEASCKELDLLKKVGVRIGINIDIKEDKGL
jgi:hypothetical protein